MEQIKNFFTPNSNLEEKDHFLKFFVHFLIICTSHDFIIGKKCPNLRTNSQMSTETDDF